MEACIFLGVTCRAADWPFTTKAEATAQSHAIRELASKRNQAVPGGPGCNFTHCLDKFQNIDGIYWEVAIEGGRIDILMKGQDHPEVALYEVKRYPDSAVGDQLARYKVALGGLGLQVEPNDSLKNGAVLFRIDAKINVALSED